MIMRMFLSLLLLAPAVVQAQAITATATGSLEFEAPTYQHFGAFRQGQSMPGKASVHIWLPPGDARVPAVMIGHSIGGWSDTAEGQYVKPLLDAGYAVLGLDHFGPRGIKRAADVPGAFSNVTSMSDALLALQAVAGHPRLDAKRVGIMGLSMGGVTTEGAAFEFVRRKVLGSSDLAFAAHVSFYAPCAQLFSNQGGRMTTGAPMLRLIGDKDETTPLEKCAQIDKAVRAAEPNTPWRSIIYPGAHHAWDQSRFQQPQFMPHHVNSRLCPLVDWGAAQPLYLPPTGNSRSFNGQEHAACLKASSGYTLGYNAEVTAKAKAEMLAFFAEHLKP